MDSQKQYAISLDVDAVLGDKLVKSTTRYFWGTGVFINISTQLQVAVGDDACLVMALPRENGEDSVKLYGKVGGVKPKGIAVQFDQIPPYFTAYLKGIISEHSIQSTPTLLGANYRNHLNQTLRITNYD